MVVGGGGLGCAEIMKVGHHEWHECPYQRGSTDCYQAPFTT